MLIHYNNTALDPSWPQSLQIYSQITAIFKIPISGGAQVNIFGYSTILTPLLQRSAVQILIIVRFSTNIISSFKWAESHLDSLMIRGSSVVLIWNFILPNDLYCAGRRYISKGVWYILNHPPPFTLYIVIKFLLWFSLSCSSLIEDLGFCLCWEFLNSLNADRSISSFFVKLYFPFNFLYFYTCSFFLKLIYCCWTFDSIAR